MNSNDSAERPCPCGSGHTYGRCCRLAHTSSPAADAASLMRSRYSAYVLGLREYLLATWHPSTRPQHLELDRQLTWLGLSVRAAKVIDAHAAEVEFVARCRAGGAPASRLHERSSFVFEEGRWWYVDGIMLG